MQVISMGVREAKINLSKLLKLVKEGKEVLTVLARIKREKLMTGILIDAAIETLNNGPWRRINLSPDWKVILTLSKKWPIRGADLWHLAIAKSIQKQIPELLLLTFDTRLQVAVEGERF